MPEAIDQERRHSVSCVRLRHDGQHQTDIQHRQAHRSDMPKRPQAAGWIGRYPPAGRLEGYQTAECARYPYRAASVGSNGGVADACGEGCSRSAARSARCKRSIPRITRNASQRRIGNGLPAKFWRRGFSEDNGTLLEHTGHCGRVFAQCF